MKGQILQQTMLGNYQSVLIGNTSFLVHKLVELAWMPNHDSDAYKIVNHIDKNKLSNKFINLEWTTVGDSGENQMDVDIRLADLIANYQISYEISSEENQPLPSEVTLRSQDTI